MYTHIKILAKLVNSTGAYVVLWKYLTGTNGIKAGNDI